MEEDRIVSRFVSFLIDCSLPILVVLGLGMALPMLDRTFSRETRARDISWKKETSSPLLPLEGKKTMADHPSRIVGETYPAAVMEVTEEGSAPEGK